MSWLVANQLQECPRPRSTNSTIPKHAKARSSLGAGLPFLYGGANVKQQNCRDRSTRVVLAVCTGWIGSEMMCSWRMQRMLLGCR
jgi:hypothetical protein